MEGCEVNHGSAYSILLVYVTLLNPALSLAPQSGVPATVLPVGGKMTKTQKLNALPQEGCLRGAVPPELRPPAPEAG